MLESWSPRLTVLPLFEPTYGVAQLCGEVKEFLGEAFSAVWVAGEAQRVRPSARGHVYFELVEKGERDEIVGKLDAVIWKGDFLKVQRLLAASQQKLVDGVQIRCRGGLDFYAPSGRLQLCVREVDPAFTLGLLERRRRETLAALTAAGLLEANRALPLAELPLAIALITSHGSAAYHDFLSGLIESGYGFRVTFFHAAMQGKEAEREVVSALRALQSLRIDAAVLIRGGGSRTDLAAFDSRAIAEAIARAPFPVLTGLGHEIDRAIADLTAHSAFKTPTKVAEFLIERMARADQAVADLRRALSREALEPLRAGREALGRAERGVSLARMRLAAAGGRIDEHARTLARLGRGALRDAGRRGEILRGRLAELAPRRLAAAERQRVTTGERIAGAGRGRLREAAATLQGVERLCQQLAPERTLERGFSLTRDAAGRLVRQQTQVRAGDLVTTRVAGGDFKSRVED
ncbi:MAG TPA: exodeoxyribonuclease VII large subunit [Thermoanaerobaculia bacterium]|nr:exodeoxyribonuclease VII large subunit [Thermoanaerobaculia bacterium]